MADTMPRRPDGAIDEQKVKRGGQVVRQWLVIGAIVVVGLITAMWGSWYFSENQTYLRSVRSSTDCAWIASELESTSGAATRYALNGGDPGVTETLWGWSHALAARSDELGCPVHA